MAPNGARRIFYSTNPDLADILVDTDSDFENLFFLDFSGSQIYRFLDFQIPGFPDSRLSFEGVEVRLGFRRWQSLEPLGAKIGELESQHQNSPETNKL